MPVVGMEFNKQQKVGVVVAAVALGVLGVDRFFLGAGGPASASAQDTLPGMQPVAHSGPMMPTGADDSLATRLEQFARQEQLNPGQGMPDLFGGSVWEIKSVFGAGTRGGVRIGQDLIRVGQEFRGATLVGVSREEAVFRKSGREFRVPIDRPDQSQDR